MRPPSVPPAWPAGKVGPFVSFWLVQLAITAVLMSRRGVTPRPRDLALLAAALAGLAWLARTVAG